MGTKQFMNPRFTDEDEQTIKAAHEEWGLQSQVDKTEEELIELLLASNTTPKIKPLATNY